MVQFLELQKNKCFSKEAAFSLKQQRSASHVLIEIERKGRAVTPKGIFEFGFLRKP